MAPQAVAAPGGAASPPANNNANTAAAPAGNNNANTGATPAGNNNANAGSNNANAGNNNNNAGNNNANAGAQPAAGNNNAAAPAANNNNNAATTPAANANTNGNGNGNGNANANTNAAAPQQSSAAPAAATGNAAVASPRPGQVSLPGGVNAAAATGVQTPAPTTDATSGALVSGASAAAVASVAETPTTPIVVPSYNTITPSAPHKSHGLSSGAIGGIVGGVVGGLAFAVLVFFIWRMCRGRGEKIPPPPPRPIMQALPRPTTYGGGHSRNSSLGPRRASSYSTLLAAQRPGSTYQAQQYYTTYPAASTPSFTPEQSPRFGGSLYPSGSASLSSSGTGANTPSAGAVLAPREASFRDGASSSDSGSGTGEDRRLRTQGSQSQLSASGERPVTPSERSALQGSSSDSRTTSPRASTTYLPSSLSSLSQGVHGRLAATPRSSSGGVPHTRNNILLTMPRPLSQTSGGPGVDFTPPTQLVYTPRSSFAGRNSYNRNSYQSARSYSEFGASGTNSAPRSPTQSSNPRRASTSMPAPILDNAGEIVESPTDVRGDGVPVFINTGPSQRLGHGIV